jgi:hypothetical protein
MLETDSHLFFHCTFAKAVWFCSPIGFRIDAFDTTLYPSNIIQSMLQTAQSGISIEIFSMLWCIWKARNDYLFNRKTWSVLQVHHAAAALLSYSIEDKAMPQEAPNLDDHRTVLQAGSAPTAASFLAGIQAIPWQHIAPRPGTTVKDTSNIPTPTIFTDAAWSPACWPAGFCWTRSLHSVW